MPTVNGRNLISFFLTRKVLDSLNTVDTPITRKCLQLLRVVGEGSSRLRPRRYRIDRRRCKGKDQYFVIGIGDPVPITKYRRTRIVKLVPGFLIRGRGHRTALSRQQHRQFLVRGCQ